MIKTYVYSAIKRTPFLNIFSTHDMILPSIAGRDAKALAPNFPSNLARAFSLPLTQFFTVAGSLLDGLPRIPKVFLIAKIIVDIVIPTAVKTDIIPKPCSLNRVFIRSFKFISPSTIFFECLTYPSKIRG